jgi:hypothetical protein
MAHYSCAKTEPAPPGTTLEQVFNGCKTKSIYFLQAKLREDAIRKAFREGRLISCGHGRARLNATETEAL